MKTLLQYREKCRLYMVARRKNPEFRKKEKEYYQQWYETNGRNRAMDYREAIYEWRKNHPEATVAHGKVQRAILTGKIKKADECSQCRKIKRLSAHHDDYSKPLEILWPCSSCHKLKH